MRWSRILPRKGFDKPTRRDFGRHPAIVVD
jgi:hypothetical protein